MVSLSRTSTTELDTNSAVDRAAKLLAALGHGRPSVGLSLGDISAETDIPKSTALRLLTSLEQRGFVERDSAGRFRIGLGLVDLVFAYLEDLDLVEQARAVLEELCKETGETVHLGIPSDREVVYIDKVESSQSLRMVSRVGARSPLSSTALGKAILAYAGEEFLSQVIAAGLEARTVHTLVTPKALRADLASVRSAGYAVDREENKLGICCVAAAVRERSGRVVAAISVSGPSVRMDEGVRAQMSVLVRRAADKISGRLGYRPVKMTS